VLLRIVETDATPAEALEAFTWGTADDQIGTELERGPRDAVARVYEILKREELDPDIDALARCDGRCSEGASTGIPPF